MPARLTRVRLKDYRSIANCDVELQPLTLLVGPNGAGKSNFIDSLRFLHDSMQVPLGLALRDHSNIFRKLDEGRRALSFSIELEFVLEDGTPGTYSLIVSAGANGAARIESERCRAGVDQFDVSDAGTYSSTGSMPGFTGDRPALVAFGAQPAFAPVFLLLARMTFCSPNPEAMRKSTPVGSGAVLFNDASNAADVLERLDTNPTTVERLRGYLHSFNPEFSDVFVDGKDNFRWLAFTPSAHPSGWNISGSEVSDGTLRAFGILLAIFQRGPATYQLSLVGLEEPEANLHPAAADVLLDALLEASQTVPIIAATHSADLLDRKDLPPKSILAVAMREGETIIGPIEEAEMEILQKRLYTAGELLRSNQLNPR
jgi:predicted ATPase